MSFLPGIEIAEDILDNDSQYRFYLVLKSVVLILLVGLLSLCIANIYKVLYQNGMWRSSILLTFYIFSLMSILARILASITMYAQNDVIAVLNGCQPIGMLAVGLIQTWMIIEIYMKLKGAQLNSEAKAKKCLTAI